MQIKVTKAAKKDGEPTITLTLSKEEFNIIRYLLDGDDIDTVRDIIRQDEDPVDRLQDEFSDAAYENDLTGF